MAFRACVLILAFATLALATVWIRSERTRAAARCVMHENEWVALRRELWSAQANVARLRAPARLHDSLELFRTNLATRNTAPAGATARPLISGLAD
jgi:hypothetical protein